MLYLYVSFICIPAIIWVSQTLKVEFLLNLFDGTDRYFYLLNYKYIYRLYEQIHLLIK